MYDIRTQFSLLFSIAKPESVYLAYTKGAMKSKKKQDLICQPYMQESIESPYAHYQAWNKLEKADEW